MSEPNQLTEQATSRFTQTKRWKLHYNEAGEGHAVFLLHGTGPGASGWSNFAPTIPALAQNYRVIALDLPGWGRSDPLDPTAENREVAHAEAVRLLMDELGLETAAIVGNSMGGRAAFQFAADHNPRLSHLITMGAAFFTVPNIFQPGGLSEGIRIIRETYEDPSPENFRRLVQIMVYDASFATDALLKARSEAALANPEHLTNWLKPFRSGAGAATVSGDLMAKLSKVATPSLFIHGRDDRVVHMEGSLRAVTVVPNSRLHIFNRCGHWAQIEHASEFNSLVDNFIRLTGDGRVQSRPAFGG